VELVISMPELSRPRLPWARVLYGGRGQRYSIELSFKK